MASHTKTRYRQRNGRYLSIRSRKILVIMITKFVFFVFLSRNAEEQRRWKNDTWRVMSEISSTPSHQNLYQFTNVPLPFNSPNFRSPIPYNWRTVPFTPRSRNDRANFTNGPVRLLTPAILYVSLKKNKRGKEPNMVCRFLLLLFLALLLVNP